MKKLLIVIAIMLGCRVQASATLCSLFHTWATGETLTATNLNGINTNFVTCGNAIDNTNIGSAGIFASQVKPTTVAQATFGSGENYTFPQATIYAADAASKPSTSVAIWNDDGATNGLFINVPTSSTNGIQLGVNGTAVLDVLASGNTSTVGGIIFKAPGSLFTVQAGIAQDGSNDLVLNVPTSDVLDFNVNGVVSGYFGLSGSTSQLSVGTASSTSGDIVSVATSGAGVGGLVEATGSGNGGTGGILQADNATIVSAAGSEGAVVAGQIQTPSANNLASVQTLSSGTVTWTFSAPYNNAPICVVSAVGADTNNIRISAVTAAHVIATSSSGIDGSNVDIICIGRPN